MGCFRDLYILYVNNFGEEKRFQANPEFKKQENLLDNCEISRNVNPMKFEILGI